MEFWTERETGRVAGGRVLVVMYADHVYLGALACAPDVADEIGARIHLPDRIAALHKPCHDPGDPGELCPAFVHTPDENERRGRTTPPICRECEKPWPCRTAVTARIVETRPADETIPTGIRAGGAW